MYFFSVVKHNSHFSGYTLQYLRRVPMYMKNLLIDYPVILHTQFFQNHHKEVSLRGNKSIVLMMQSKPARSY